MPLLRPASSHIRGEPPPTPAPAPIVMTRQVLCRIMCTVGAFPAETGGILLGPVGSEDITGFFFDSGATCSGATYSPDHVTLARKLKDDWLPYGIDFKGFVHSHPGRLDRLSAGDLRYIRRLLQVNTDMDRFLAPLVIPHQRRLCPIVVPRNRPDFPQPTVLRLI